NPKVILADEPTGALDSKTTMEVINIFKEVNDKGMTVIIVTHENEISKLTDRVIFLKDGRIIDREVAIAS
ncbi:MAG: macrolide ABC transporter ATP-binding protein, partial [Cyclobacteriaceae bacterium]|nr:macrolide ABC transporter ATP-binding protein [Cyclobacteriaceae bacterium]